MSSLQTRDGYGTRMKRVAQARKGDRTRTLKGSYKPGEGSYKYGEDRTFFF
jgi:hypothetical protein